MLIFAIASSLTYTLGRMTGSPAARLGGLGGDGGAVSDGCDDGLLGGGQGEPDASGRGSTGQRNLQPGGNMEGKEVRFGIANSALFATVTSDTSCGAVNSQHDSFTPLGGMVPMINIMLGEVVFGGVGSGLYGVVVFVILAVFIAGLMVGRTPEYLGKKIESFDVKMAMLSILIMTFVILGFSAVAVVQPFGTSSISNPGPHGLSAGPLRVYLDGRQQRLRLRRTERQHGLVQHQRSGSHVAGPLLHAYPHTGHRREPG